MVTAKTQYNLKNAKEYFEEHLCVGDYYEEGQRVTGQWFGLAAQRLGLTGKVGAEAFLDLCENRHPSTGEMLTQRLNTTRIDQASSNTANRRIFYDFTFSPPKPVSLAALVGGDDRILEAHAQAVRSAMKEFEAFASTRVRAGKANCDRFTGNLVVALFTHDTSRALDPHLHTHCIVFNATFDLVENRWKALQNYELLRARKFAENVYYHELVRSLRSFGYGVRNQAHGDFQIQGISDDICKRFSKRHTQIDEAVKKLLAEKPERAGGDLMAMRRLIATGARARKQKELGHDEQRALWNAQMSENECAALRQLPNRSGKITGNQIGVDEAVQWAEDHLFDRNSVVLECQLWHQALERGRGENFSVDELKEFTHRRPYIRNSERPAEVTLREVLLREMEIVQIVKDGAGNCRPIVEYPSAADPKLDEEQRLALNKLLRSTNAISLFRGGAGTGKSFVLRELIEQIRHSGWSAVVLAPQRQQVVAMEYAKFPSPTTVTSFLLNNELAEGTVIIVDEAGQIGGRQMSELLRLAWERNARVILSGDTRQHGAVEASDALLAIERHSGVKPVELHAIRRQDPALGRSKREASRIKQYRKAVEVAAAGRLAESFERLHKMGAVVSCGLGEQADKLAAEYVRLSEAKASAVVVSQTWAEVHRVNSKVRDALKGKGLLGTNDVTVQALEKLDLTNAQKRDLRFYPSDAVVVFNRKVRQTGPGASGKLIGIVKTGVLVEVHGKCVTVANKVLDKIAVCVPRKYEVAEGDRLHLKANRKLASGTRVTNGELVTIKSVHASGKIELTDGRILDESFREFLPGYAVTSYGSQGKTVDYVLFSDSTVKAATNAQQWYVTISRGRRGVRIFTPDKEQLRENLTRSGHRPLACDFVGGLPAYNRNALWGRLRRYLLRFGQRAADTLCRLKQIRRPFQSGKINERQSFRMLHH
ncbi:MAG TPA: MobF family relaxase [Verrucomicrobiae bacterium]|nr:MobF family relaxase [Verrucomicrobiae bacterium]